MAATGDILTVLETCQISPPPATVGEKSLPLTFFDLQWLPVEPIPTLYFYDFPHSKTHFTTTIVPNLKHSLSITLPHFFPFAGNLIVFLNPNDHSSVPPKPEIRHVEGDSVALTFAECSLDFNDLSGNHPRDCDKFYPLIPSLGCTTKTSDHVKVPLFSVQVTLFPNCGISIGITFHHVLCDASSLVDFLKAWASITETGSDESFLAKGSLPLFDRVIKYPPSIDQHFLRLGGYKVLSKESQLPFPVGSTDNVRATFVMSRANMNRLKTWVLSQLPTLEYVSSFSVTCAYVWSCLAKSRVNVGEKTTEEDELEVEQFICSADGRARLDPPIPQTYFGNCICPCFARTNKALLLGHKGFIIAAEMIGKGISKVVKNKNEVLKNAETWFDNFKGVKTTAVTGTPKWNFYDVDFGWGKPRKHEWISIDNVDGAFSMDSCKESEEGIEIGMSLPAKQMDAFATIFTAGLEEGAFLVQE